MAVVILDQSVVSHIDFRAHRDTGDTHKYLGSSQMKRSSFFSGLFIVCILCSQGLEAFGWEWSDWVGSGLTTSPPLPLSIYEISELRVREIKRRLALHHGYSADELARILDKKELIEELAFAEEKARLKLEEQSKRTLTIRGIVAAFAAIVVALIWPLLLRVFEVACVNFVVYTDRKSHEWRRCSELRSYSAYFGVIIMAILDALQLWLTASVLLSWVMRSKYFFPIPHIPIRPMQMLGGEIAKSSAASYGINVGSMAVTWVMRFVYGYVEGWTGKEMARAHRNLKKQRKDQRKADRKKARTAPSTTSPQPQKIPSEWLEPVDVFDNSSGEGYEQVASTMEDLD